MTHSRASLKHNIIHTLFISNLYFCILLIDYMFF
nr:MAG TPA: hypothetical protein [Caudoviricetes sp.]